MREFKHIKTFDNYFNTKLSINNITSNYIDGYISEQDFYSYIEQELINENIITDIKEKILNILYTFLIKAYELGYKIYDKLSKLIKWLLSSINKFREKNPTLYKIIIITIITFIILIVSSTTIYAQSKGHPVDVNKINLAIGWLEEIKGHGDYDNQLMMKAMAHLIDMKDGIIDIPDIGEKAMKTAEIAMKTTDKMLSSSKENTELGKYCLDLIEKGSNYIGAAIEKYSNTENIRLYKK